MLQIKKDLERAKGAVEALAKKAKQNQKDKATIDDLDVAKRVRCCCSLHACGVILILCACAGQTVEMLEANKEVRHGDWANKDIVWLNTMQVCLRMRLQVLTAPFCFAVQFLTAKPVVFLVNIGEKNFIEQKNKFFKASELSLEQSR